MDRKIRDIVRVPLRQKIHQQIGIIGVVQMTVAVGFVIGDGVLAHKRHLLRQAEAHAVQLLQLPLRVIGKGHFAHAVELVGVNIHQCPIAQRLGHDFAVALNAVAAVEGRALALAGPVKGINLLILVQRRVGMHHHAAEDKRLALVKQFHIRRSLIAHLVVGALLHVAQQARRADDAVGINIVGGDFKSFLIHNFFTCPISR